MACALVPLEVPLFLRMAANPVRWQLLTELVASDQTAGELVAAVGERQNAVAYHLAQLRAGGLVSSRRSTADGRDRYYRLELARCAQLFSGAGATLHPALAVPGRVPSRRRRATAKPVRVLFLCTGNSGRSPIAQALLQAAAGDAVSVLSAGSHPKPINPIAVRVMRDRGLDLSAHRPQHLDAYARRRFDHVITVCDRLREICPTFPGHPQVSHWGLPDPATATAGRARLSAFQAVADDLATRIDFFLVQSAA